MRILDILKCASIFSMILPIFVSASGLINANVFSDTVCRATRCNAHSEFCCHAVRHGPHSKKVAAQCNTAACCNTAHCGATVSPHSCAPTESGA
jgi:hypothetical protein